MSQSTEFLSRKTAIEMGGAGGTGTEYTAHEYETSPNIIQNENQPNTYYVQMLSVLRQHTDLCTSCHCSKRCLFICSAMMTISSLLMIIGGIVSIIFGIILNNKKNRNTEYACPDSGDVWRCDDPDFEAWCSKIECDECITIIPTLMTAWTCEGCEVGYECVCAECTSYVKVIPSIVSLENLLIIIGAICLLLGVTFTMSIAYHYTKKRSRNQVIVQR
eukprot:353752_1